MKKTRGMMADVANDLVNGFLNDTARSFYIKRRSEREIRRAVAIDILPAASTRVSRTSELVIGVLRRS
jgi:hypothetical protein